MRTKLLLAFSLIAAFAFLVQGVEKPFIGLHDWNGVQYGNMARNYIRYGVSEWSARLVPIIFSLASPFAMIYSKFTAFYSDRNISHFDKNKTSTPKQADVEVIIKEYPPVQFDPKGYQELDHIFIRELQ